MMRAMAVAGTVLAATISSAYSEDFTCDQWLLARATDPSQDNKDLKPLITFVQGYIAALNEVSDGLNPVLKLPVRPTEVGNVLSDIDDRCRHNLKASGPASIEMQLKANTALHLLPVVKLFRNSATKICL